jgi:lysozyme
MGDKATEAQCKSYLYSALEDANKAVEACTAKPMPDYRHAAMVSFAYNAGGSAYCRSTMVRMLNAGDISGACDELIKWVNAGGKRLPGLVKRRTEERIMCLSDK